MEQKPREKRNEQYARQEGKLTKNQIGVADNRPTFVTLINQSGAAWNRRLFRHFEIEFEHVCFH